MKVLVLGAGLVGVTIAKDLADECAITVVDKNNHALTRIDDDRIDCVNVDFLQANTSFLKPFDIVVGALPGHLGYEAAKTVISASKDYVDISFAPEDLRDLHSLAYSNGVRCLIDFGVAPGLSNLVFGYYKDLLKKVREYHIYVGGLLRNPDDGGPWFYKAPFSPIDVIEEYTRPARYISGGKVTTAPALSQPELLYIDHYGGAEAFLTDGARSLLSVKGVDTIIEKTIRPVGYREKIQLLMESGFFSTEPMHIGGQRVCPREMTERLLIDSWKMNPSDQDMTYMKLTVKGTDYMGFNVDKDHYLFDYHDGVNSSMARTTGFMCAAGVRLLGQNVWEDAGVFAPEEIGENRRCFRYILENLERHGIKLLAQPPLPKRQVDKKQTP